MNLLLFDSSHVQESGTLRIEGESAQHVRRILKSRPGDSLRVGELDGRIGKASVLRVDHEVVELDIPELNQEPPPPLGVDLILALPRPKFLGRLLQDVTALGVKQITLVQTARVEKSYWSSRVLEPEAVDRHLRKGLQQARDTRLPAVHEARSWATFIRSLPDPLTSPLLVAEGSAANPFPRSPATPSTLFIGPEGGLLDAEIDDLVRAGGTAGHLGSRVLRVETAAAATLARFIE